MQCVKADIRFQDTREASKTLTAEEKLQRDKYVKATLDETEGNIGGLSAWC